MKITNDKILIEDVGEQVTKSGLFMPNKMGNTKQMKVVAIGPGRYNPYVDKIVPVKDIAVGDTILVKTDIIGGLTITKDGERKNYFIISPADVISILEEGETL